MLQFKLIENYYNAVLFKWKWSRKVGEGTTFKTVYPVVFHTQKKNEKKSDKKEWSKVLKG